MTSQQQAVLAPETDRGSTKGAWLIWSHQSRHFNLEEKICTRFAVYSLASYLRINCQLDASSAPGGGGTRFASQLHLLATTGVIRRNAGSSSSLIRRMLESAWPTGMPLQCVRKIRKLAPASSQHGRSC